MRSCLNPEQDAAVHHVDGPLLVLAGAGTGKTRVLVSRVAHLVDTGVPPSEILAVTFTNKAAREMKERLSRQLGARAGRIWIGTFHAICARLLRELAPLVGLTQTFTIFDVDDQTKLLGRLLKELGLAETHTTKSVLWAMDRIQSTGGDPATLVTGEPMDEALHLACPAYQAALLRENATDFHGLLAHVLRLLDSPAGESLRTRFRYVLVDEFQDTNRVQFGLVAGFAAATRNLMVVGDDDQSIYAWRGADPRNILDFDRAYHGATVIRLEQNYRSTSVVLQAANAVIEKNVDRHGKRLWTAHEGGEPLEVVEAGDERTEARLIATEIARIVQAGRSLADIAILYRTNAQSRVLEEQLRERRIAAVVVGGMSFFERKEVKDAMAYVRMLTNPSTDLCCERIINVPARGIGDTTIERVRAFARAEGTSLLEAARRIAQGLGAGLTPATRRKVAAFVATIDELAAAAQPGASVAEVMIQVIERSGLRAALEATGEEGIDRVRNLAELVTMASDFDEDTGGEGTLSEFDERCSLYAPADKEGAEDEDAVTLMTIHAAKGLEFAVVFMSGMEDGLFPSLRGREGVSDVLELEEERRLAYVAITRAKERLVMTHARTRRVWGSIMFQERSRFIDDIPDACFGEGGRRARKGTMIDGGQRLAPVMARGLGMPRQGGGAARTRTYDEYDQRDVFEEPVFNAAGGTSRPGGQGEGGAFVVGGLVEHQMFGQGRVLSVEGKGDKQKILVQFARIGTKHVLSRFLQASK
ncbi:MAG: UvrD-helicase domain-containing protein [Myxococcales bacterium]|nr:UvrD-helicase domain-containing protein [Myxococcales bacterium]